MAKKRAFVLPILLVDSIIINPGAREWLDNNDPDWHPEFRKFVEERLAVIRLNSEEAGASDNT